MKYKLIYSPGDMLGEWTILDQPKGNKWLCRCKCGYEAMVVYYNLIKQKSKTCYTCSLSSKHKENNPAWKGLDGVPRSKWTRLLKGASTRGIEVAVDFEYVVSTFQPYCALSGLPIDKSTGSIDRIDSKLGYVHGNIQWVHKVINKMKNDLAQEDFISMCKAVTTNNGE